mmetsp:Transcript_31412/g.97190  ORF Transcript_31412/g.97190 Transcript_31412/m.97190 type:complete len:139 (-) Transcript_31412:7746-8162(-)
MPHTKVRKAMIPLLDPQGESCLNCLNNCHLSNPSEASTFNKYLQIFQFLLCPVGQFPALIALQMYHYRVMNSTVPRLPLNVSALTAQSHHHLIQHLLNHFPASIRNLLKPASIRILVKLKSQKRPPSISLPIQSSAIR